MVLEKTLESPLDCKEIKQVIQCEINPEYSLEGHWCWSWNSNTLATWCKKQTYWKNSDVGKDWGQKEKGVTEDETIAWHHQLSEHKFEQNRGDSGGQRSLVCCGSWCCRVGHDLVTEQQQQILHVVRGWTTCRLTELVDQSIKALNKYLFTS